MLHMREREIRRDQWTRLYSNCYIKGFKKATADKFELIKYHSFSCDILSKDEWIITLSFSN